MRIAYFTSIYPRATDTFIQREVSGLRQRGHEVVTIAVNRPQAAHLVSDEIKQIFETTTYLLPFNPLKLLCLNIKSVVQNPKLFFRTFRIALKSARPGVKGFIYQLFYFQEALILAELLKSQSIDHVHNHFGDSSGTITMLASLLAGVDYSITIHGPHIFFEPMVWALDLKLKYAKFIACISHYCKSQLMLFSNAEDWHKLKIVHCGIDFNLFNYDPTPARELTDTPAKMIYVGRLSSEKGVQILLKSLSALHAKGFDFKMTFLGDGPERHNLEMLTKENGLSEKVIFAGFASQETVKQTLSDSDIFILPSFAEGVPVSFMEAMATGVPVIGTNVGGVTELIEHGVSGIVVPPADVDGLEAAISMYLESHELRSKVKSTAYAHVVKHFNLQHEIDKLAAHFIE
ncbi:glycosyltransferase family 4 protein [Methylophilus sp. UBA6697]|jgi:glycosyltransferase involved in cell wall biosynthesis|uniref:glycosyltransferase family 4 protein n=1 Tax=Methylophilus sp. UBA6697 TaxID=1946902 RepID=UPI000ECFAA0B|nr:glycosyltransferase family 4 protein [Methylophilus sp. UBA6697]HCU85109.1 colanic acid biosynthesis glycosyltransferase WcaL [Methylophilus sp.]